MVAIRYRNAKGGLLMTTIAYKAFLYFVMFVFVLLLVIGLVGLGRGIG